MWIRKFIVTNSCLLLAVTLVSCVGDMGHGPAPAARDPEYSVGTCNATNSLIDDVRIWWPIDGRPWLGDSGGIGAGSMGACSFQPGPIPARVHLEWTTPDGVKHAHLVEVASKIDDVKTFSGVIWFKFVDFSDAGYRVVVIDYKKGNQWQP
jgi:hypothetical protein